MDRANEKPAATASPASPSGQSSVAPVIAARMKRAAVMPHIARSLAFALGEEASPTR